MQVWDLVAPFAVELHLQEPRLYMAESGAPVDYSAPATLLNGEPLILQEGQVPWDARSASDVRLRIVEEILSSEKDYCHTLKTVSDLYEKPLRKLLSMEKEDYKSLFDWVEPVCSLSKMVIIKLNVAVEEWETYETKVATIFSKLLWTKYEEYQNLYENIALPLLKEKETSDEDFVALCQLRRGAAKYSLAGLLHLPLERLVQYERYLSLLAEQTAPDHPDYNDICRTANKASAMVKRADHGREESDLDRIQDLFPSDHLRLHERDPLSPRKGLMRSKSSAASKIQRALPGKSKTNGEMPCSPSRPEAVSFQKKHHLWGDDNYRVFIMESPVHFTMGVQKQDRHLFLFNDLLLVAKPRSGGTYKLKEKIRMSEMWLSQCLGDVCESIKSPATAFVIGWPTTNVVVTFSSLKTKDLWQQKLLQLIEESKEKEGKSQTSIQISFRKPDTGEEICKTLKVDNRLTSQDCIKLALQQLGYLENGIRDYKLWVKTGKDEAPYPLIGHEYPFSIKMNFIRELLRRSDLDLRNLNNISTDSKCYFILRRNTLNSSTRIDPRLQKKRKKHRRPHPKINWPFRRPAAKHDSVDSGNSSPPPHSLFGLSLWKLCPDNMIPKPVMSMLVQLFQQGPFTVGIFRKSANARACRELKEKLESDPEYDLRNVPIIVLSSVFKEFLRSLPDCLLQSDLYKHWLQATSFETEWECKKRILSLLAQLPPPNIRLLQYLLCMLWHIAQHSSENKMSSMNLAVCIGPTLLNPGKFQSPVLQQEDIAERVPKAVSFLIDHCAELFGDQVLQLLGASPERDNSRQDSGAEESDSLHSLHDLANQYRRDDSSIDSLDRDFLDEIEPSPKLPCKSKMSLTNLSRDSGLTLSDTQLYTPEEEVESESSSADSRRGNSTALTKSVPHLDTAGIDCNTASYGKNAGVSIDGTCHDVMRKRRLGMEAHRTKSLAACSSCVHPDYHYERSPHLPLQLSQSYSYSMQQDLMDRSYDSFVRNYHNPVRRRDVRGRSGLQRPIVSSVEPVDNYMEGTLRRSASEESLLQKYVSSSASKRMLTQRKRRAPSPPQSKGTMSAPCSTKKTDYSKECSRQSRSVSREPDRHAVWFATHSRRTDWKRSQSTSKIDEIDQAHDSSTISLVSSEDSTPQVSRSNSRVQELSSKSHSDLYAMYYSPQRVNSVCSSTSDGSQQSHQSHNSRCSQSSQKSNNSHKSQHSNCSINNSPSKPSEPPSYLEAINRQTLLKQMQHPAVVIVKNVTDEMRAEQTSLSAKARELYENSVRMYSQQIPEDDDTHRAVPANVDCTDGHRKSSISVKGIQTSPRISSQEGAHIRLRHHPPVHVTDSQLHNMRNFHIRSRREILPEELRKEINWSVAQLREFFNTRTQEEKSLNFSNSCLEKCDELNNSRSPRQFPTQQHTRSRSLSSRSEEESFV
ncbi:uncharacterized protein [Parasteatoda tepidariorum]|nr:uncharacterized protein LOC107440570 isoform X2 [Parasteatoda tepidariorum]